ncbi:BrnA antitoxin family protein [Phyllobacterium sp. LjRoot231]|uniref:BrnA antitoxin family protein n=1 Tax=Phyllobacterium sp. LjRoot231 TaxID=3342289 RepID=UPI003ED01613
MATTPRRPSNPIDAAEALFKPLKRPVAPINERPAIPNAKELVSLKIDRDILEHFQQEGSGWQDRINDALRMSIEKKP